MAPIPVKSEPASCVRLRADVQAKLRTELSRLARSKSPRVKEFVRSMLGRYPELRA